MFTFSNVKLIFWHWLVTHRGWVWQSRCQLELRWGRTARASYRWQCWPPGQPSTGTSDLRRSNRLEHRHQSWIIPGQTLTNPYRNQSLEDNAGGPLESLEGSWYNGLWWSVVGCREHAHWEIVWEEGGESLKSLTSLLWIYLLLANFICLDKVYLTNLFGVVMVWR